MRHALSCKPGLRRQVSSIGRPTQAQGLGVRDPGNKDPDIVRPCSGHYRHTGQGAMANMVIS